MQVCVGWRTGTLVRRTSDRRCQVRHTHTHTLHLLGWLQRGFDGFGTLLILVYFPLCVQSAAGCCKTWRWSMWRWMTVVMPSQLLKVLFWVYSSMTNLSPRRRQKWQHNFMEGRRTDHSSKLCSVNFIDLWSKNRCAVFSFTLVCVCVWFLFSADSAGWERGMLYAEGQNLARLLMEAPANHVTPTTFANTIEEKLAPHAERVTVHKRFVRHWLRLQDLHHPS